MSYTITKEGLWKKSVSGVKNSFKVFFRSFQDVSIDKENAEQSMNLIKFYDHELWINITS